MYYNISRKIFINYIIIFANYITIWGIKLINELGEIGTSGGMLLKMWEVGVPSGSRPLVRHSHIRFEITLITAGSGIYTVGDRKYTITPGEIFVFASNEQHYVTEVGENGLKMVNLHFEPRCLWGRSFDSLSNVNTNFCFQHSPNFENCIPAERAGQIRKLFLAITAEFAEKRNEYTLQIKSLLNMIIIELIRNFGYCDNLFSASKDKNRLIRKAAEYIDAHYRENLTLETLAGLSGLTPNYFSSLFSKVSGIKLWDYINSRRIEAAMQLLRNDHNLNIIEIASKCGFNNTANFNKAFKKTVGITPGEYRLNDNIII